MRSRALPLALSAFACAALNGGAAQAATATANMTVSIQVTAGCTISVSNIAFTAAAANTLTSAKTTTSANGGLFTYACSNGAVTPTLSYGQGANFLTTNRMKGGTSGAFLPYTLTMPTLPALTGATQTAQIVATIPAQTTLPVADTYSDTVVLTINY